MLPKPIYDEPEMVNDHPYINFLRYMKRTHPKYGFRRLMQKGLDAWEKLTSRERKLFERERLLRHLRRYHGKAACNCPPKFAIRIGPTAISMADYRARMIARHYRLQSKWQKANQKRIQHIRREVERQEKLKNNIKNKKYPKKKRYAKQC